MLCPSCQAPIEADAVFCGHCGTPLPPVHLREAEADEAAQIQQLDQWPDDSTSDIAEETTQKFIPPRSYPLTPAPVNKSKVSTSSPGSSILSLSAARPGHKSGAPSTGRNLAFIAVILAILGIGIAAGFFALWQNKHIPSGDHTASAPFRLEGVVTFHDTSSTQSGTNTVSLTANGLKNLTAPAHYAAWLVDENEAHIQPLGTLAYTGGSYKLDFNRQGGNILAVGSIVQVTQETTQATLPTGRVVLNAHLPLMALMHVKHLLVSFPSTPNHMALLPGLLDQTRQLSAQSQLLSKAKSKKEVRCVTQNIFTLLDGQHLARPMVKPQDCAAAHVSQLSSEFGILGTDNNGYISTVGAHASLAATQTDSTDTIRKYAQQVIFSSENLKTWLSTLRHDAQDVLAHPEDSGKIKEILSLSDYALNGVDSNNSGNVDPVRGEAGALQAYLYGQSMATLKLSTTNQ
ncbi:hypothetical protein KDW_20320 [Dictyobacter vulcani]|uniref:Zinc-ribbon domain-containing protein n=1 Tax=Dictyobacter vulcani TaxID=2607529 RepID=A0A5J4KN80_9CHLR|nr:zinc ribbon domain-containing protein [Dictyobacter vulcani]GER87870.1 hypothetical protein KDW_20320 [Dictyobacter vulcani]